MDDSDCCTSDIPHSSNKRKKPDDVDHNSGIRPLRIKPIDNEYEDLSEGEVSDEEDEVARLAKEQMEQIEMFQEEATVTDLGGIKITPFNLEEEKEEGEFDEWGNFIFRRRRNSGNLEDDDNWAQTVDWDEVKRREEAAQVAAGSNLMEADNSATQEVDEGPKDKINCYKEMLRLMKPNENVKKTIRRMGEAIPKRKPMNKNKRSQKEDAAIDQASIEEMRRNLDLMIELAHQRMVSGDEDIYQKTYEELERAINI